MFPLFFDPTYILVLPALIFAIWAQAKVQSTFGKYLKVRASSGMTGSQVARDLLNRQGLRDVAVEETPYRLADHYDPRKRVLSLSPEVYRGDSLAALGVAAHETGHALQHATNYLPLGVRHSLVPAANLGSSLAVPLFLIGFIFAQAGLSWLMTLGIWIFLGVVAFQIVTLPVEYNATGRALALLEGGGYLSGREVSQAKHVLDAAALTYVAATAVAVTQLLRLLVLRGSRDD